MRRVHLSTVLTGLCVVASGASLLGAGVALHRLQDLAHVMATMPGTVQPSAVREALLQDPEMLVEAGRQLQARAERVQRDTSKVLVEKASQELRQDTAGFLGNPQGRHVVVEFFDYQCLHCREAVSALRRAIQADPELKIVLRDLPILGQGSEAAARVALAAAKQGLYLPVHEALMQLPLPIVDETAVLAATTAGADRERLVIDAVSAEVTQQLEGNLSLARRIGVANTPSFAAPGAGVLEGYGNDPRFRAFTSSIAER